MLPRRGALLLACCALWVVAAAAVTAWALQHLDAPVGAPVLCVAAATALLAWRLTPSEAGRLVWDGSEWRFRGEQGRLRVMMDLDRWLLLRFEGETGPVAWLGLGARTAGPGWHAVRAAVYWPGSDDQTA